MLFLHFQSPHSYCPCTAQSIVHEHRIPQSEILEIWVYPQLMNKDMQEDIIPQSPVTTFTLPHAVKIHVQCTSWAYMCPCALGDKANVSTEFATYVTDFVFYHGIFKFCYKYQTLNDEERHCHCCVIPVAVTVLMNITLQFTIPQCFRHTIWVAHVSPVSAMRICLSATFTVSSGWFCDRFLITITKINNYIHFQDEQ